MADEQNTKPLYYNLDVYSNSEWSDHANFCFTGPTYEAVLEKARKHNVDFTDIDKWLSTLYYRSEDGIVANTSLIHCYNDALNAEVAWDGKWSVDEDPIPSKREADRITAEEAAKAETEAEADAEAED